MQDSNVKKSQTAQREEATLAFWKEQDIFKKTLARKAPKGDFVFYEGPPTANGHPAIHHLEARAFKDLIPRYKAMQGYRVRRKAGWDTHGLPVELEVEKELGLKNKKEVEGYGIEKFNQKCKESVLRYIDEWKEFTDRIGFWVDHDETYFTFANDYIESVWNILKTVDEKELLYKDYRVVPWCTRCGTPLSSHEVADGYKDVTDTSIYVLFKLADRDEYIAAWTTTPWTLPGNVALAINEDLTYGLVAINGKRVWMAKDRAQALFPDASVEQTKQGKELLQLSYEPLFPYLRDSAPESQRESFEHAYKIFSAAFVGAEDGTGVVHIAPMYGADDFELGTKHKLPKHHVVNEEGKFIDAAGPLAGMYVKKADKEIITLLGEKVLRIEEVVHSYPHCWRCKSPLIYYARDSWYIRMSEVRSKLVSENKKIHWEPSHIRDGRFGEWLKEVKDWAISRNRFWGTPLPIWRSESGKTLVVGSLDELKKLSKKSGNSYFMMRHGESEGNVTRTINSDPHKQVPLTQKGREQVEEAAKQMQRPDYIYVSPLTRAQQTAQIVAQAFGIPDDRVITDARLQEIGVGVYEGRSLDEYNAEFPNTMEEFTRKPEGGENWMDVKRRAGNFLYDIETKHQNSTILLISHGDTTWLMQAAACGADKTETLATVGEMKNAEVRALDFTPLPVNGDYELDVHRPYIDTITLEHDGETYVRVPEVLDVWFDSGAMPFAQDHYPFENKKWIDGAGYPADFISEAIDQTRGWFYTLHAIGVLMGRGAAYKNVICLGHLLDDKGKKMSKSQGNVINPWNVLPKYGADALRYWMYAVNEAGASKNFDERTVEEIVKKHMGRLLNVLSFYELYKQDVVHTASRKSAHVLDRWIIARIDTLTHDMTEHLDAYEIDRAVRPIADFIDDLSTWYLRRSRDRIKGDNEKDKKHALATLRYVLLELSILIAPAMPFLAEHMYQAVGGKKESVHLDSWPKAVALKKAERDVLDMMQKARDVVSLGLEARAAAQIKVRQPLQSATLKDDFDAEVRATIRDELNVKEIRADKEQDAPIVFDLVITDALKREGELRDILRAVQELRKKKGLQPGEPTILIVGTGVEGRTRIEEWKEVIMKAAAIEHIEYDANSGDPLEFDDYEVRMALK
ncbi:MAG: class I tRNA ligase family protein [Parcubacteria group bacterium]|nr:class I tRNA ligase family protein [Parcubacteria group bacterium]